nr:hypothetical protein [Tanacetum cinerariifolium]GEY87589.1 hypothetical protein [Tanacetum cinerariifolium]
MLLDGMRRVPLDKYIHVISSLGAYEGCLDVKYGVSCLQYVGFTQEHKVGICSAGKMSRNVLAKVAAFQNSRFLQKKGFVIIVKTLEVSMKSKKFPREQEIYASASHQIELH